MDTETHDWHPIPDAEGYEVCRLTGQVRSLPGGRRHGRTLRPKMWQGRRWYTLGKHGDVQAEEIELRAFGPMHTPRSDRVLSDYELFEIRNEEGLKPAHILAEEWNIDTYRVRQIWAGLE